MIAPAVCLNQEISDENVTVRMKLTELNGLIGLICIPSR